MSPFAPRKPRTFAERKATLIRAPILTAIPRQPRQNRQLERHLRAAARLALQRHLTAVALDVLASVLVSDRLDGRGGGFRVAFCHSSCCVPCVVLTNRARSEGGYRPLREPSDGKRPGEAEHRPNDDVLGFHAGLVVLQFAKTKNRFGRNQKADARGLGRQNE